MDGFAADEDGWETGFGTRSDTNSVRTRLVDPDSHFTLTLKPSLFKGEITVIFFLKHTRIYTCKINVSISISKQQLKHSLPFKTRTKSFRKPLGQVEPLFEIFSQKP